MVTQEEYLTLRNYFMTTFTNFKKYNLLYPGKRVENELNLYDDLITDVINFIQFIQRDPHDKKTKRDATADTCGCPADVHGIDHEQGQDKSGETSQCCSVEIAVSH